MELDDLILTFERNASYAFNMVKNISLTVLLILLFHQNLHAAPPPPPRDSQISDLRLWGTGDIADRVLTSVRDVSKLSTATARPIRDVSGIPEP